MVFHTLPISLSTRFLNSRFRLHGALKLVFLLFTLFASGRQGIAQCAFTATANPKGNGCFIAEEQVRWAAPGNVTVNGNNLTKSGGGNGWNAGAESTALVADGGYMYTVANETNINRMIGLSTNNQNNNFNSIHYAFYMRSNGLLGIYESGNNRGDFAIYNSGDTLRIVNEGGKIKYFLNNALLRTVNIAAGTSLLVDCSINTVGGTLGNVHIGNITQNTFTATISNAGASPVYAWSVNGTPSGTNSPNFTAAPLTPGDVITCALTPGAGSCAAGLQNSNTIRILQRNEPLANDFNITSTALESGCIRSTEPVLWNVAALANVESNGNDLWKIQSHGNWDGGAISVNTVVNNGYLEFTNSEITRKAVGLSHTNPDNNFNTIRYAFFFELSGNLKIYENGADRGSFGSYAVNDVFRILVDQGVVKYYRNGTLLRISNVAPTLPMFADVSLLDIGATVTNPVISNFNGGTFTSNVQNAGTNPVLQWKLNGANVGTNSNSYTNTSLNDGDIITCELTPNFGGCAGTAFSSGEIIVNDAVSLNAINFYISGSPAVAACATTLEEVVWNRATLTHNEATGNNLIKIQSTGNWDGNAASLNRVADNGYFEFINSEITRKTVGLSDVDVNSNFTSIKYGLFFESGTVLRIYENGIDRGTFGNYAIGDVFRIAVESGVVKYYQNGTLIRISTVTPTLPLLADVSLRDIGATVTNAVISNFNSGTYTAFATNAGANPTYQWKVNGTNAGTNSSSYSNGSLGDGDIITCELTPDISNCASTAITSAAVMIQEATNAAAVGISFYIQSTVDPGGYGVAIENIAWNTASLLNVQATDNNLMKVLSNNNWNGNASSHNTVKDNGYFEFTATETNRRRMVGLSHTDADSSFNTIRYAFDLNSTAQLRIFENGANRGLFGNYAAGDIFRITVEAGVVNYYRNGALIYTSALVPTLPLLADVSISNVGGTVSNALVANITGGVFTAHAQNAGASPGYQWKLNGNNVGTNSATYSNLNLLDGDIVTCDLTPDIVACGTSNFTSNIITISGPDGTTDWIGVVSTDWHNPANWSSGVPNQFIDAFIPAGTPFSPAVNAPAPVKHLEIAAGANLTTASSTMQIYGDINNFGTVTGSSGTVAFLGGVSTTISGNITRFNRVIINKTSELERVILNTSIEIIDETVFIMGIVETGANEVIYINGADSREGLPESHVEGVCRKIGNQEFRFPVGRNGIYAPIRISAPALTTDEFTANYLDIDPEEDGYIAADRDPTLATLSRCEYWMLNREVGTSSVSVTLSFENVRSCGVTDPTQLKVSRWNGTAWQDHGYLTHTGDANSGTVTSGLPILNFSPFTLGSGSSVNPLPIDLLSFEAKRSGNKVDVKWTTASEVNNDFFTLERSSDGVSYSAIAIIQGAGNSSSAINYVHSDMSPLKGTSYYRLRQTDFDGTSKVYPPQSVYFGGGSGATVFPNPTNGIFKVMLPANDEPATLRLLSASGAQVWTRITEGGIAENNVQGLSPGIYILEVEARNYVERFKLVIR